jgi:putative transposase
MAPIANRRAKGELMEWARILAYISGTMDQELLLRNEYLTPENQILRGQLKGRPKLSDAERAKLGEIGRRLGRKALGDVATAALPDTILGWYRRLVARKFDGSKHRSPGRPRVDRAIEELIVLMAEENRSWGYDRIVGALANLGFEVSDQTVGNVLRRHGVSPAPERKRTTTWQAFIRTHLALLAGSDFFTAEVLTLRGLATYYVLFVIHLESRRVDIAGITIHPDELWMKQIARNVTMEGCGVLRDCSYLLHDRDTKYTQSFRAIIASGGVEPLALPARSPNLNAYAERWVRSVKEEYLSKVILLGERSLRRALNEFVEHYHAERNHQGKGNVLLFPRDTDVHRKGLVQCRERLAASCAITIKRQRDRTPKVRSKNFDSANRRAATGRWRKSRKPLCYALPQLYAPASAIAPSSTGSSAVPIFWPYGSLL